MYEGKTNEMHLAVQGAWDVEAIDRVASVILDITADSNITTLGSAITVA